LLVLAEGIAKEKGRQKREKLRTVNNAGGKKKKSKRQD
jgi:hypothetical protein